MDEKFQESRDWVRKSLNEVFVPEVALIAGVLSMKLYHFDTAEKLFERNDSLMQNKYKQAAQMPPEYYENLLYLARVYEIRGKHNRAAHIYDRLENSPDLKDTNIRYLAHKRGYTQEKVKNILTPFSTYIPIF